MKTILLSFLLAAGLVHADSYTYRFVPRFRPLNVSANIYPHGSFTVDGDAVRSGFAVQRDVLEMYFRWIKPVPHLFVWFDEIQPPTVGLGTAPVLQFDLATHYFINGGLRTPDLLSTTGYTIDVTPWGLLPAFPSAGAVPGFWTIEHNL